MIYGALAFTFLLTGLGIRSGTLIAFAAVFVATLAATRLREPAPPELDVRRELESRRVGRGGPVSVTLRVTNTGESLPSLVLADEVPRGLAVRSGSPRQMVRLAAGETFTYRYAVSGRRGRYRFGRFEARSYGFSAEHVRLAEHTVYGELTGLPPRHAVEAVPLLPRRTLLYHGPIRAGVPGEGIDFFDVREYAEGDPIRRINWRASARHENRLFTTDFERERIAEVGIIVDGRLGRNPIAQGVSLFEYSVAAAVSLSDSLLADGHRVGLITIGTGLSWTFPGYGKRQAERIYTALANAAEGDSAVFDSLDSVPTRVLPASSQVIVISPVGGDDVRALNVMAARGYSVVVVRPDPLSLESPRPAPAREAAIAARLLRIDRVLTVRELERVGVPVVSWDVKEPFEACIRANIPRLQIWRARRVLR